MVDETPQEYRAEAYSVAAATSRIDILETQMIVNDADTVHPGPSVTEQEEVDITINALNEDAIYDE